MKLKKFDFLLSPWSIILGMVSGIIIGIYFKPLAIWLKPVGQIYVSILKMCIIPIMASAILVSLSKLLKSEETSRYLNKIIIVFVISLFLIALIGSLAGLASIPLIGNDSQMKKVIGEIMLEGETGENVTNGSSFNSVIKEIDSRHHIEKKKNYPGIIDFIQDLIPRNIFFSLTNGSTLQIVFFFIILGIMLKFISDKSSNTIIIIFEGIFEAFQKLIKLAMYLLPLGLCSLLAYQFTEIGFAILGALIKLIILIYIASLVIFIISTFVIWKYTGGSYFRQFKALDDAIVLALGTRTSYAALPSAISGLINDLGLNHERTKLTVSLGFTLCKYGKVMIFCIGAIFAAHLYEYPLTLQSILIIIIGSVLAGMAASGAPSIVSRAMIAMVLAPLGIPSGAIIVILLAIDPITDPIITLISTYPNYAVTAIIAKE